MKLLTGTVNSGFSRSDCISRAFQPISFVGGRCESSHSPLSSDTTTYSEEYRHISVKPPHRDLLPEFWSQCDESNPALMGRRTPDEAQPSYRQADLRTPP